MEEYDELPFGITDDEFEDIEEIEEVEDNNVWSFVKTLLWTWLQKFYYWRFKRNKRFIKSI